MKGPTLGKSRVLSLRAPIANEEERALYQRRLSVTAGVVAVLSSAFYIALNVSVAVAQSSLLVRSLTTRASVTHLVATFASVGVWAGTRSGRRSTATLGMLDVGFSIAVCIGWSLLVALADDRGPRPEYIAILATSYTLVVRAALLPSTPARTAILGVIGMVPILPVTQHLYPEEIPGTPLHPTVYAAMWAVLGVAATTVISHVIYGLRLQVRKAMQLGQYVLEDKIGEGGMGTVYRASHALLRRPAALKLLAGTSENAVARFEREVQITARLTHPNTVAIFDYGRTPQGVFYYAMEYLEGVSLEDLVEEHGEQDVRRVVHLLLQACGALEEAHAAGLVHRDVKPANIMLTERGGVPDFVKILDFGLVKESDAADAKLGATSNTIMGTPHYLAPEAIKDPSLVDGRTDIYALGATAYYLLTGKRAFEGEDLVEVCSKHLHDPPLSPRKVRPDIPESLTRVVLACLAKAQADRPKDAGELARQIRACKIEEWTREEAVTWWSSRSTTRNANGARLAARLSRRPRIVEQTMTVALDNRPVQGSQAS